MSGKVVTIPGTSDQIHLVPRRQLRQPRSLPKLTFPERKTGVKVSAPMPTPPASLDWAGSTDLPILGNNQAGDCFYAAACHMIQTWAGANGTSVSFAAQAVLNRYYQLSGGDNGLDWATMMGEFKSGIIGPNGPHQNLATAALDVEKDDLLRCALNLFGPIMFTLGIPDAWLDKHIGPGEVWDAGPGVKADPANGHAVILSGYNSRGWIVETWGLRPQITLTYAGLKVCDPEAASCIGTDWFLPDDKAPNGYGWAELRDWWQLMGGPVLPLDPPKPIPPGPAPAPPTPTPNPFPCFPGGVELAGNVGPLAVSLALKVLNEIEPLRLRMETKQALLKECPPGYSPEEWSQIIELLLQLLGILFGKPR